MDEDGYCEKTSSSSIFLAKQREKAHTKGKEGGWNGVGLLASGPAMKEVYGQIFQLNTGPGHLLPLLTTSITPIASPVCLSAYIAGCISWTNMQYLSADEGDKPTSLPASPYELATTLSKQ